MEWIIRCARADVIVDEIKGFLVYFLFPFRIEEELDQNPAAYASRLEPMPSWSKEKTGTEFYR
jgi:hypothetical protein